MTGCEPSFFDPLAGNVRVDDQAKYLTYFCTRPPILIGPKIIDEMLEISRNNADTDLRLCLHDQPHASQHDMIIVESPRTYYRPHKHPDKCDVIHVIRGRLAVFLFDEHGGVTNSENLGPGEIYRIPNNLFHTMRPITDPVVYHENKPGPYIGPSENKFAPWSPEDEDPLSTGSFTSKLSIDLSK
jgi:cupin fold WbuC family metalloprotein